MLIYVYGYMLDSMLYVKCFALVLYFDLSIQKKTRKVLKSTFTLETGVTL